MVFGCWTQSISGLRIPKKFKFNRFSSKKHASGGAPAFYNISNPVIPIINYEGKGGIVQSSDMLVLEEDSIHEPEDTTVTEPEMTAKQAQEELQKSWDAQDKKNRKRRAMRDLIVKKLPHDILREIFDKLGPANQRILGATCRTFYGVYKEHYKSGKLFLESHGLKKIPGNHIFIDYHGDLDIDSWSKRYTDILINWIGRPWYFIDDDRRSDLMRLFGTTKHEVRASLLELPFLCTTT